MDYRNNMMRKSSVSAEEDDEGNRIVDELSREASKIQQGIAAIQERCEVRLSAYPRWRCASCANADIRLSRPGRGA